MSENKLVEFLDKWLSDYEFEMTGEQIATIKEIKGILEQQAQPDEELVDDLIHASFNYHKGVEFKSVTKERIRKLLRGKR